MKRSGGRRQSDGDSRGSDRLVGMKAPPPAEEVRRSPLPSAREIDKTLQLKYGTPPPLPPKDGRPRWWLVGVRGQE